MGATHVIDTSKPTSNLGEDIKSFTGGIGSSVTIDTTGNKGLIATAMDSTANRGQMILVGVPEMTDLLDVHLITFMQV